MKLVLAAAHKASAVFGIEMHLRAEVEPAAEVWKSLAHDHLRDQRIDLDGGDVCAAAGDGAGDVPAAAGADDQRLGRGKDHVGQAGALIAQVAQVARGKMLEIEIGDLRGGVGVDEDGRFAGVLLRRDGDAREAVPLDEQFVAQLLVFGEVNVRDAMGPIEDDQREQGQAQRDAEHAPRKRAGHSVPDRGGGGEQHRHHDDGVFPAHSLEQWNQRQATAGCAQQVEKVNLVDALHALGDGQRNDCPGEEEGQRGGEIDERQPRVGQLSALPDHHGKGEHYQ